MKPSSNGSKGSFFPQKKIICKNQYVVNGKPDDVIEEALGCNCCLPLADFNSHYSENLKTGTNSLPSSEKGTIIAIYKFKDLLKVT